jgi:hypothetical protein
VVSCYTLLGRCHVTLDGAADAETLQPVPLSNLPPFGLEGCGYAALPVIRDTNAQDGGND